MSNDQRDVAPRRDDVDASIWKQAYEEEAQKFQQETLRTSEQAALLAKWVSLHDAEHGAGPWSSKGCAKCLLVDESKELLIRPINLRDHKIAPRRDEELERLRAVYKAARGLCHGSDWNNGTAAGFWRKDLVRAVNAIEPLPDQGRPELVRIKEAGL